jgi:hypothetical protein
MVSGDAPALLVDVAVDADADATVSVYFFGICPCLVCLDF